jgi:hypothetical protein
MAETKTSNIYQALLAAQQDMGPVYKNATNPAFKSHYAELSSVVDTITPTLNKHGIVHYQPLQVVDGQQYINTVLCHAESGTTIESLYKVVSKDPSNPQAVGGGITYGRRYSLMSILGLAPEDDDGNLASQSAPKSNATPANPSSATGAPKTSVRPSGDDHDEGEDVKCGIPSCKNVIKAEKVETSKKYNKGHVICYTHSTNGDWEGLLAKERAAPEPTAYDIARQ